MLDLAMGGGYPKGRIIEVMLCLAYCSLLSALPRNPNAAWHATDLWARE